MNAIKKLLLGFIAVCALLAACEQQSDLSPREQVERAQARGNVKALKRFVSSDARERYTVRNLDGDIEHLQIYALAAYALRDVTADDEEARSEIELFLAKGRDGAQDAHQRGNYFHSLSIVNRDAIAHVQDKLFSTAMSAVSENPDSDRPIVKTASDRNLKPIIASTPVDAIIVLRKGLRDRPTTIIEIEPRLDGKTTDELQALEDAISTIGVVHQWFANYGIYQGGCAGYAYQIHSNVFILNQARQTIVSGMDMIGGKPPLASPKAFNSDICDSWGKPADHGKYLQIQN